MVTPGLTATVPVALEVTLVEVEWSVSEVTIEDRYEIIVSQTFETQVPTSVLVVDPPGMNMPDIKPGEVYNGEYMITNHGLISVQYNLLDYVKTTRDYDFEVLVNIPATLGPNEKIILPYRVTRKIQ